MNKYKRRYISKIADALTKVYGDTLRQYDTDLALAEAAYRIFSREQHAMSEKDFFRWKEKRKAKLG